MSVCDPVCVHDLPCVYDDGCVHGGVRACGHVGVLLSVYAHGTAHEDACVHVYDHWYVHENVCDGDVYDDVLLACVTYGVFGFEQDFC